MFGKGITVFKLFGFEVRIDASWIFIVVLVTWTLALGFFPYRYSGLSKGTYWWMGIIGALGLFASIVFHELFHSLVARRYGLPIHGITLFIFGGISELEDEPPSAKAEFFIAFMGPFSSIFLGFLFFGVSYLMRTNNWPVSVFGVFAYISWINFILAFFNLVPAFPLDGGRVLRSILWQLKNNIFWATHISSWIGSAFGMFLILLGVVFVLIGSFISGIWFFLIGMFLRNAAKMSYQQLLLKKVLQGESVKRFMKTNPITVPPDTSLTAFVNNYIYRYHYPTFPIVNEDKLIGCVGSDEIKNVSREDWDRETVQSVVKQCSTDNTVTSDTDAMKAFLKMNRTNNTRLMVIENDRLIGAITLKDMFQFFSAKLALEGANYEE